MLWWKVNYFLISLFDHTNSIEIPFDGGKVREDWTRKPHGGDGIELGTRVSSRTASELKQNILTSGSLFR
jgi:hypothetical protein